MGSKRMLGVAILISDKIDLKIKNITRDKEGHYINAQGVNPRRRHNNCKYLCTQHRSTSIHKRNTAAAAAKSLELCPTLWDSIDSSPPGSAVPGILQARMVAGWMDTKQDTHLCCLQETHFRPKDIYRLKVRGWKNISRANGKQKKAGVAILISDKIDLKIKKITRDKERHYIMIKGSIQEEDITIVNIMHPT